MLIQLPGGTAIDSNDQIVSAEDNGEIRLHTAQALSRLIEYWKDKPNLRAWLSDYTEEIQEIENVLWDVIVLRLPDYASYAQLDGLGAIVGEPRNGLGDAAYRTRIKARILINQSFGRARDLIKILQTIDPAPFHLVESGTASFYIYYDTPLASDAVAAQLPEIIAEARAAGVGGLMLIPTSLTRGAVYGHVGDPTLNASLGWGTVSDPTYGGLYANAVLA